MSAIEKALADLRAMRNDYIQAAEAHANDDSLGPYCRGKRDAYIRAVICLSRAQREETRWDRIKAVFR